jgi:hypothetical protein
MALKYGTKDIPFLPRESFHIWKTDVAEVDSNVPFTVVANWFRSPVFNYASAVDDHGFTTGTPLSSLAAAASLLAFQNHG